MFLLISDCLKNDGIYWVLLGSNYLRGMMDSGFLHEEID